MSERQKINYLEPHGHTFTGVRGCVHAAPAYWKNPIRWDLAAERADRHDPVMWDMGDFFEDWRGPILDTAGLRVIVFADGSRWVTDGAIGNTRDMTFDDVRADVFSLIDRTPHLDWLLPTKRPERIRECWCDFSCESTRVNEIYRGVSVRRDNVWLGCSVSTQAEYDAALPHMAACRDLCPVLWWSFEPLVGPISLGGTSPALEFVDWIVCGCESGHGRRPFVADWARSLRDQCAAVGVPLWLKQIIVRGRVSTDESEWPADLRGCRALPEVTV